MKDLFIEYSEALPEMLRYAMLRSEVLFDYGLYNGKMGMAILFYEYSFLYKDNLYEEYADILINSILELPDSISLNMENGLSGIAWGLVYLFNRNFIEGDIYEILQDIDKKLIVNLEREEKSILSYYMYRRANLKINYNDTLSKEDKSNLDILVNNYQDSLYTEKDIINIIWNNWINYEFKKNHTSNMV